MRVLWFAVTPSLYDEQKIGGWIASLERIMRQHFPNMDLGIAFEHTDNCLKKQAENVTYYPMKRKMQLKDKLKAKIDFAFSWQLLKPRVMEVISDFKPDVIHCFGSEWPFASIASEIDIPVVVHMQGFLNIINMLGEMAFDDFDELKYHRYSLLQVCKNRLAQKRKAYGNALERNIMQANSYFMGRTQWDKNLVKHYSKNACYFYCPEAIRKEIYESDYSWTFQPQEKMQLITVSQAGAVKGNEIILRTADLLKNQFHFDFTWKVAGNKESFKRFESKTGICAKDVNIELLGFIDADTIAKELSQAQLYVHPSIIDNSPNSLCEAQLVGCPVVATNVGGIPQLVENGVTGILYPYNEPHTLAFHIMDLHNNQSMLEHLSENARRVAKERHDPKTVATTVEDIYRQVIAHYQNKNAK